MAFFTRGSKNKYNACKKTWNGRNFHSLKEMADAQKLEAMKKAGLIASVNYQKCINIVVNGKHICKHYVDFEIMLNDGRVKWVETKGMPTDAWQIKKKLVEAIFETPYLVNPKENEVLE